MQALRGGARECLAVDVDSDALRRAQIAASANGVASSFRVQRADALDCVKQMASSLQTKRRLGESTAGEAPPTTSKDCKAKSELDSTLPSSSRLCAFDQTASSTW